jgi:hypothetical protein
LFVGCSSFINRTTVGRCYLKTGLYLVYGDTQQADDIYRRDKYNWPKVGYVEEVFEYYNTNQDLELYEDLTPTIEEINEWVDAGYRVAVLYEVGKNTNHSKPFYGGKLPDNIISSFVSGVFLSDLNDDFKR